MDNAVEGNPGLLNIGISMVDTQHKIIFDLIGDLYQAEESVTEKETTETLLFMIENEVFRHFESEEKLFAGHRDADAHHLEHYAFIKDFHKLWHAYRNDAKIFQKVEGGPAFLETWFIRHVRERDMPLFYSIIKEGGDTRAGGDTDAYPESPAEKRWCRRIGHDRLAQKNVLASCYNTSTLKKSEAMIIDISLGGLLLQSDTIYEIDDLLILTCAFEDSLTFQEKARVRYVDGGNYGTEFINISPAMEMFLMEMYTNECHGFRVGHADDGCITAE